MLSKATVPSQLFHRMYGERRYLYLLDPNDPVPSLGGNLTWLSIWVYRINDWSKSDAGRFWSIPQDPLQHPLELPDRSPSKLW